MIRTLLTTTALAAFLTSGAMAQTTAPAPAAPMDAPADPNNGMTESTSTGLRPPMVMSEGYAATQGDNLATKVIGAKVYTSTAKDADEIGSINDLVIDANGDIAAAVVGVGGFLGVGEKNVAVDFAELKWSTAADGTWRYVLATTADALKTAPDFVYDDETAAQQAANIDANNTQVAVPADKAAAATPLDRSTLKPFDATALTSEELKGVAVYGIDSEQIGSIGDFALNADGKIDAVIVDVGGFLGLGKKPVAVGFDSLAFSVDADNKRYLFINTTKEQLEAQPEFNRDTYTAERDTQRLVVAPQ
jgi:sporulation protein YlmC with PRC-barrel domain